MVLGPSGGKSVLLKHIVGLLQPDSGRVVVEGKDVAGLNNNGPRGAASAGGVCVSALGVVRFDDGAGESGVSAERAHERVALGAAGPRGRALELVDMAGFEGRRPGELSGGQQRRVAAARAIVLKPALDAV